MEFTSLLSVNSSADCYYYFLLISGSEKSSTETSAAPTSSVSTRNSVMRRPPSNKGKITLPTQVHPRVLVLTHGVKEESDNLLPITKEIAESFNEISRKKVCYFLKKSKIKIINH